jgi:hypothetical protein
MEASTIPLPRARDRNVYEVGRFARILEVPSPEEITLALLLE